MDHKRRSYKPKQWTLEERKKIEYLLSKKQSKRAIGVHMAVSYDCIRHEILTGGGNKHYNAEYAHKTKPHPHSNSKRTFSDQEKERIISWIEEGHGIAYMRQKLRCGAQRLTEFIRSCDVEPKNMSIETLIKRIQSLEEHIKILYDLLEGK